jgi:hypothetical protein
VVIKILALTCFPGLSISALRFCSQLSIQEVILLCKMKIDLSHVQQASAMTNHDSDDESNCEEVPEWEDGEPFDSYYAQSQHYLNRPGQDAPPSPLPSPFLKPHERVNPGESGGGHEGL